jgi:hypothetical protein
MHIIPHNLLSDERMWAHSCCLTPPRSRTGTKGWGAWRMLWCVRERSRPSSPSQLWVAGPLSPYNVFIYLFCIELLLCSKVVTFDPVPWFIICVRLGPSTPGDYVRAQVLVPRNPSVTHILVFVVCSLEKPEVWTQDNWCACLLWMDYAVRLIFVDEVKLPCSFLWFMYIIMWIALASISCTYLCGACPYVHHLT